MEARTSLQDRWAPGNRCFGCGPANAKGLRLKSFPDETTGDVVCTWTPSSEHEAFEGILNGGIIGALFDCHCNWTAVHHLMRARGLDEAPPTVTSEFHVFLKRPTPTNGSVLLRSRVVEVSGPRVTVEAEMHAGGKVTATSHGVFVAVEEGHPAYHRW